MQGANRDTEINLVDSWNTIKKRKKLIGIFVTSVTVLTAIISLCLPKYYVAEATIVPLSNGGGSLSSLASLGGLLGIGGATTGQSAQPLMVLLKSFTITEQVIKKNNLVFEKGTSITSAVNDLLGNMEFSYDQIEGTIKIRNESKDPQLAAKITNSYIEVLQSFLNKNALTSAKRNRIFVERQLLKNKRKFLSAGTELNDFYKGSSSVMSKINVPISEPKDDEATEGDTETVKGVSQQVYLQYLTAQHSSLAQINALLTQQFEMAKIEEAREDLAFQIVDAARVPEKRSKPERKKMVVAGFFGSLVVSVFLALFAEHMKKMKVIS